MHTKCMSYLPGLTQENCTQNFTFSWSPPTTNVFPIPSSSSWRKALTAPSLFPRFLNFFCSKQGCQVQGFTRKSEAISCYCIIIWYVVVLIAIFAYISHDPISMLKLATAISEHTYCLKSLNLLFKDASTSNVCSLLADNLDIVDCSLHSTFRHWVD